MKYFSNSNVTNLSISIISQNKRIGYNDGTAVQYGDLGFN